MVVISCSTKFHAFSLAEQLERENLLTRLYTIYHQKQNSLVARFNKRKDPEEIKDQHIKTFPMLAPLVRLRKDPFVNNDLFDRLVSKHLRTHKDFKVFIGWSGMSLHSLKQVKALKKTAVLERGSCHISEQYDLLREEYKMLRMTFEGDHRVESKEKSEYETAEFITVPSTFAKKSFLSRGFSAEKIFVNNFGAGSYFKPTGQKNAKFTVLYLGAVTVQKGVVHLFRALQLLKIPIDAFEVWFIGRISDEMKAQIAKYQKENWRFFGHVDHYALAGKISACSVMVQPSIQEGLSMVIPQAMSCGVPVIASTNTGGEDIIEDRKSGFIVPIRSPESIAERITLLFESPEALHEMQDKALKKIVNFGSWEDYGRRYSDFIKQVTKD
jgi:glycosyltransferase involved in cell wall biosynthesis